MTTEVIRVVGGRVVERHENVAAEALDELLARAPDEFRIDLRNTPLSPNPQPVLPTVQPNGYPSIEELTDAVIAFADGDEAALNAIRARRRATPTGPNA